MKHKKYLPLVLTAITVAIISGFFSSLLPDGLERVSRSLYFTNKAKESPAVFTDYNFSGPLNPELSSIITGIFGILFIYFIFHALIHYQHILAASKKLFRIEKWIFRKELKEEEKT